MHSSSSLLACIGQWHWCKHHVSTVISLVQTVNQLRCLFLAEKKRDHERFAYLYLHVRINMHVFYLFFDKTDHDNQSRNHATLTVRCATSRHSTEIISCKSREKAGEQQALSSFDHFWSCFGIGVHKSSSSSSSSTLFAEYKQVHKDTGKTNNSIKQVAREALVL